MTGRERELVESALAELRKMGGSKTRAKKCLELALDPDGPSWSDYMGSSYMGVASGDREVDTKMLRRKDER